MKRNYVIAGIAIVIWLIGIAAGMQAQKYFYPCAEIVGNTITRETVKPIIPDGRTVAKVGTVKVKPVPAKTQAKPAKGVTGTSAVVDTPAGTITPQIEAGVTIDEEGNVDIPITDKEYKTEDYKLTVRGFRPELVDIELYRQTETVITRKPPRWALSVGPGATYTADGEFYPGVNVTLGFVIWSK